MLSKNRMSHSAARIRDVSLFGNHVWWSQQDPEGENPDKTHSICMLNANDLSLEAASLASGLMLSGFKAGTRVFNYGGSSLRAHQGGLFFCNSSGGLDHLDLNHHHSNVFLGDDLWHADLLWTGFHLIAVEEDRSKGCSPTHPPSYSLVAFLPPEEVVLPTACGELRFPLYTPTKNRFVGAPTYSPKGECLAWIEWSDQHMPWEQTSLWCASLDTTPSTHYPSLHNVRCIWDGGCSILQPRFSPDGVLHFLSDHEGFWRLYSIQTTPSLATMHAPKCVIGSETDTGINVNGNMDKGTGEDTRGDMGVPPWVLGTSTYGFLSTHRIIYAASTQGTWHLYETGLENHSTDDTALSSSRIEAVPFSCIETVVCNQNRCICLGSSPSVPPSLVSITPSPSENSLRTHTLLSPYPRRTLMDNAFSLKNVLFPSSVDPPADTSGGPLVKSPGSTQLQAFFYSPKNPQTSLPPCILRMHGGPTGQAYARWDPLIALWCNRGYAVLDLNYRGSSGFGRRYRTLLDRQWGIAEVEDALRAVTYFAEQGLIHPQRVAVYGKSAGGYSALCSLLDQDSPFLGGIIYYGLINLDTCKEASHPFELPALQHLIGNDVTSPHRRLDTLKRPILWFHGEQDPVIPPNTVRTWCTRSPWITYCEFPDEGHGISHPNHVEYALSQEETFLSKLFSSSQCSKSGPFHI